MFKLVVLVYALLTGTPSATPTETFTHRDSWDTLAACEQFRTSPETAEAVEALKVYIVEQDDNNDFTSQDDFKVETRCVPAE